MRLFAGTPFDIPPTCDRCGKLEEQCQCPPPEPTRTPPHEQTLRISVEKRKNGRNVTVIRGFAEDNDLSVLLTQLKSRCGAGGTTKDHEIEIQGKHLPGLRETFAELGYRVKG